MRQATAVLLLAASLVGCASQPAGESPWLVQREATAPKGCDPLTADQDLVLGMSQEMAIVGRRHAALANLERLPGDIPQVRLSKARLLRVLGHGSEAGMLYQSLLNSCLVADANHGLGQIAASRGNYLQAQGRLRTAASLAPASESIRNDLGVVYMNQRRMSEARFELLTAMELNESSQRAALNLLAVLLYQGNEQAARELVNAKGLSSADLSRAEQRAGSMRSQDGEVPAPVTAQPLATPEPAGTAAALAAPAAPSVRSSVRAALPATTPPQVITPVRAAAAQPAPARTATMSVSEAARAWAIEGAGPRVDSTNQAGSLQRATTTGGRPVLCRASRSATAGMAVLECTPE